MTPSISGTLVVSTLATYGHFVLIIITAVIGIGVAYLVYCFGWQSIRASLGMTYTDKKGAFRNHGMSYMDFKNEGGIGSFQEFKRMK